MLRLIKFMLLLVIAMLSWMLWQKLVQVPAQLSECVPVKAQGGQHQDLLTQLQGLQSEVERLHRLANAPAPSFDQLVDQVSGRAPIPNQETPVAAVEQQTAVQLRSAELHQLESEMFRVQKCLNKLRAQPG